MTHKQHAGLWYLPPGVQPQPLCLPEGDALAYSIGHLAGGMFREAELEYDERQRALAAAKRISRASEPLTENELHAIVYERDT